MPVIAGSRKLLNYYELIFQTFMPRKMNRICEYSWPGHAKGDGNYGYSTGHILSIDLPANFRKIGVSYITDTGRMDWDQENFSLLRATEAQRSRWPTKFMLSLSSGA